MTPPAVRNGPTGTVVRANMGLRVFCVVVVLLSAAATLGLAPQVYPVGDRLPTAIAMTFGAVIPILLGTSAIRVRGDRIQVVNALLVREVALTDIAYLDHRNGLEVVLRSGKRIGFAGSAPSLLGTITHYRSARRMVRQIDAALDHPFPGSQGWQQGDYRITRRLRGLALLGCLAYMVAGTIAALLLGAVL